MTIFSPVDYDPERYLEGWFVVDCIDLSISSARRWAIRFVGSSLRSPSRQPRVSSCCSPESGKHPGKCDREKTCGKLLMPHALHRRINHQLQNIQSHWIFSRACSAKSTRPEVGNLEQYDCLLKDNGLSFNNGFPY
jgi:hypothetical protein